MSAFLFTVRSADREWSLSESASISLEALPDYKSFRSFVVDNYSGGAEKTDFGKYFVAFSVSLTEGCKFRCILGLLL
jgi:hypothetical protein